MILLVDGFKTNFKNKKLKKSKNEFQKIRSFFSFDNEIEKRVMKNFKIRFVFKSKNELYFRYKDYFDFCFLKLVLGQNRFKKKIIFFRFSLFHLIIKIEKWKILFEIWFFISNQKTNNKIVIFISKVAKSNTDNLSRIITIVYILKALT